MKEAIKLVDAHGVKNKSALLENQMQLLVAEKVEVMTRALFI